MAKDRKHRPPNAAEIAAIGAAVQTLLESMDPTAPYACIDCSDGAGNVGAKIVIVKGHRISRLMTETMRVMRDAARDMFGLELEIDHVLRSQPIGVDITVEAPELEKLPPAAAWGCDAAKKGEN